MPKFFTPIDHISADTLTIDSGDAAHIKKVLRLSVGDEITVCDGKGFDYAARITALEPGAINCEILKKYPVETEPGNPSDPISGYSQVNKDGLYHSENHRAGCDEDRTLRHGTLCGEAGGHEGGGEKDSPLAENRWGGGKAVGTGDHSGGHSTYGVRGSSQPDAAGRFMLCAL